MRLSWCLNQRWGPNQNRSYLSLSTTRVDLTHIDHPGITLTCLRWGREADEKRAKGTDGEGVPDDLAALLRRAHELLRQEVMGAHTPLLSLQGDHDGALVLVMELHRVCRRP
jgi:hypothetical protein